MQKTQNFLAFDTSTDQMSVALTDGTQLWQHSGPGGAQASTTLIPAVMALLAQAGLALGDLQAIVFGRGPGSFTGLRTSCAVAQGLAFGADAGRGVPVLPVDTLMALADEARFQLLASGAVAPGTPLKITALLDARMDEMYVQSYEFDGSTCKPIMDCRLIRPENLVLGPGVDCYAGNVFAVYADRLPAALATTSTLHALPTASALLRLAPGLAAAGGCVDPALALPLYVRDKVAQTTEERSLARQQKSVAETAAALASQP